MICPPSTVANRRSLATRIAVTLGTASLSSAGIGPLGAAEAPGSDERTGTPASGLSDEGAGGFRAGFDFGTGGGMLTAGGFDLAAGGGALADGAGALATGAPSGLGAEGTGVLGTGIVTSGCNGARGTVFVAFTAGAFAIGGGTGFNSGLFAATLTAGGFDSGFFAAAFTAGAGAFAAGGGGTVAAGFHGIAGGFVAAVAGGFALFTATATGAFAAGGGGVGGGVTTAGFACGGGSGLLAVRLRGRGVIGSGSWDRTCRERSTVTVEVPGLIFTYPT